MVKCKIGLKSLVESCEAWKIDKRIVIIPNCSEDHKCLTDALDKKNFSYIVDYGKSDLTPRSDFYVIDFREINLI